MTTTRKEAEQAAQLRLFSRLLISYNDFRQASQIARYILKHRLHAKVNRLRGERAYRIKLLWQALNCAMVVAYCRPFSGNDRGAARNIPDLPSRFLAAFTPEQRRIHDLAMRGRNTMLAHSDSEAWDLKPFFVEGPSGRKILFPSHNDTRAPLVHEIVEQLEVMCGKVMEAVFEERKRLETELEGVLPSGSVREMLGDCMSGGNVVIGGSLGDSRC